MGLVLRPAAWVLWSLLDYVHPYTPLAIGQRTVTVQALEWSY